MPRDVQALPSNGAGRQWGWLSVSDIRRLESDAMIGCSGRPSLDDPAGEPNDGDLQTPEGDDAP